MRVENETKLESEKIEFSPEISKCCPRISGKRTVVGLGRDFIIVVINLTHQGFACRGCSAPEFFFIGTCIRKSAVP